ncbi:anti-sigma factor [Amycolatopsis sp. 195334CR]|uniref:anti-sigma factor family protein n=1 Tax=Amycolatopsis sp. 195334CR TaxID=2814588 RepID=UPI001A8C996D|nr:zf-HC2 domain-containing protein [Amycolatopsis sp. 195334CR]MBN6033932.1 zf-HC2 domain-containing protein [Amycolatopsis sp. 195334CR]
MNCEQFVEQVTAFLDGVMDPAAERRFVDHLAECDGCGTYLDQVRATVRTLGDLPPENLPPEARESLLAAFRRTDV